MDGNLSGGRCLSITNLENPMTPNWRIRRFLQTLCVVAAASLASSAATHTVTTVAGGFVGDGNLATAASLSLPVAVAHDEKGNIYVGDGYHCRIRKIDSAGVISTYAGIGICGYGGDGGPAMSALLSYFYGMGFDRRGNLIVADTGNNRIRQSRRRGSSRQSPAMVHTGTREMEVWEFKRP
jgi:hypothetical protein